MKLCALLCCLSLCRLLCCLLCRLLCCLLDCFLFCHGGCNYVADKSTRLCTKYFLCANVSMYHYCAIKTFCVRKKNEVWITFVKIFKKYFYKSYLLRSTAPTYSTSRSRRIENIFSTASCISRASAAISSARASATFTIESVCLGDIPTPPLTYPF